MYMALALAQINFLPVTVFRMIKKKKRYVICTIVSNIYYLYSEERNKKITEERENM